MKIEKNTYTRADLLDKGLSKTQVQQYFQKFRLELYAQGYEVYKNKKISCLPRRYVDMRMGWDK